MLNYPLLYLEHVAPQDLALVAHAVGEDPDLLHARLAADPEGIEDLLARPEVFDVLFGDDRPVLEIGASPFLLFGVLVHRARRDLRDAVFVSEWAGVRKRIPVFDTVTLSEFLEDGTRRFFLIEHLASFTKVASGSMWVKTRRGYRRRRFSELDPVRLAEMVDALPVSQQPAGFRRLGDVSLFLAGVFPDHTAREPLSPMDRHRLARMAGFHPDLDIGEIEFHEKVGGAWYRRTVDSASALVGDGPRFLTDIADRVDQARRLLNYLADTYLFRYQTGILGPAA